jgi:indole-3-glycerol phosphate synthase
LCSHALKVLKFRSLLPAVVSAVSNILEKIVATKRQEIALAKLETPQEVLEAELANAPPLRNFFSALAQPGPIKLIAEVKKASPSKGIIRADFNPVEIAQCYEQNGATCVSVLTDVAYFQGSLDYLRAIRRATSLPLLRKDFILDTYQLVEARVAGADAVLLIAECLDDCHLRKLHTEALDLGLTPLVELYDPENLPRVLEAGATLIGVNNRNLRTFEVDLQHTVRMRSLIPDSCLLVGESGIYTPADVKLLADAGVDAMLVGESLMREADMATAVSRLLGTL